MKCAMVENSKMKGWMQEMVDLAVRVNMEGTMNSEKI